MWLLSVFLSLWFSPNFPAVPAVPVIAFIVVQEEMRLVNAPQPQRTQSTNTKWHRYRGVNKESQEKERRGERDSSFQ